MALKINKYAVIHKLGQGGYGEIYAVEDKSNNKKLIYAMKTETVETKNKGLDSEIEILKSLPKDKYFPNLIDFGSTGTLNYFVMPLFGPSLSKLKKKLSNRQLTLSSAIRVGVYTLDIIAALHKNKIVHCDIKPSNFLLQHKSNGGFVLIDYGLSYQYCDASNKHCDNVNNIFKGTYRYASINAHKLNLPSRRDDIMSWFYSIIELIKGSLPWDNINENSVILNCKQNLTPERLCSGCPYQLVEIWNIIKDLSFEEKPPYFEIFQKLQEIIKEKGWHDTDIFDWERENIIKNCTDYPELFDKTIKTNNNAYIEDRGCSCFV